MIFNLTFQTTNNPEIQELVDKKLVATKDNSKDGFYTATEGFSLMKKGGFAFDADTARSYRFISVSNFLY